VAVIATTAAVMGWLREPPMQPAPPVRAHIELPAGFGWFARLALAISPDGRFIAYNGQVGDRSGILLRPLGEDGAILIQGTEGIGETTLTFSPDAQWLAFTRADAIVKVGVDGRGLAELAQVPGVQQLSWGVDGSILFSARRRLYRVASAGGEPELLASPDRPELIGFRRPELLPDGEAVLFQSDSLGQNPEIRVLGDRPPLRPHRSHRVWPPRPDAVLDSIRPEPQVDHGTRRAHPEQRADHVLGWGPVPGFGQWDRHLPKRRGRIRYRGRASIGAARIHSRAR
jgi:hypothetical protein